VEKFMVGGALSKGAIDQLRRWQRGKASDRMGRIQRMEADLERLKQEEMRWRGEAVVVKKK
jgi:hypothetical protein